TNGAHVFGRTKSLTRNRIIINTKFVDDQSVPHTIGTALMENDVLQMLQREFVDRCGVEFVEWNPYPDPAPCGNISRKLSHRQGFRERRRKLGNLQTLACRGEHKGWQVCRGDRMRGETPEVEIVSRELRKTVAEVY